MISREVRLGRHQLTYDTVQRVQKLFEEHGSDEPARFGRYVAATKKAHWAFETVEELIRFMHENEAKAACWTTWHDRAFQIDDGPGSIDLKVSALSQDEVLDLSRRAEEILFSSPPIQVPVEETPRATVFLGHGRSGVWQTLRSHLQDQHGIEVRAYETGARAGHTIRDILAEELDRVNFAVVIMTAEDEQSDGQSRARQNVVHEAGLFQGRLGFNRVAVLVEEGLENFTNLDGLQYIPFSHGKIRETYGDVLAMLRREFPSER